MFTLNEEIKTGRLTGFYSEKELKKLELFYKHGEVT